MQTVVVGEREEIALVDWVRLAQDTTQWRSLVGAELNLRFSYVAAGPFLAG
jgi:hypothetical protein